MLFDFYSEYCPPCRAISPYLEQLNEQRGDLVVVKVDINRPGHQGIDWESPVARQYQLRGIPHFLVYDGAGQLAAEGAAARSMVSDWLNELR